MAKKKSKRAGKHDLYKRYERTALGTVKRYNLAISYSYLNNQYSRLIDDKNMVGLRPAPLLIDMLTKIRYKWGVTIAALCVDQEGRKYMRSEFIKANEPYLQSELADYLEDEHERLLESCNRSHLVNATWIASPIGREYTEKEAFDIFEALGSWYEDVNVPKEANVQGLLSNA